ncbi:desulfoferrodoxin [Massilimicrobiota sp. An105]|uniref:desulfoferrodoxin family protein n=1 Tax=Massilimicrobiota sp. An105 TaxID=1965540 RepID=UPI000B375750|nr:desulfoferrodoxin family protein [Massilimicrobiota sp. An105]OUQ76384.1 desulfoferrodoxin [Massilimicrobiota sp. An105]
MKLYVCPICGNVVEKIVDKGVPVVCCGKPMVELTANTTDGALEKHVPVLSIDGDKLHVKVGEVSHPMTDEHLITTIIAVFNNQVLRVDLTSADQPEAVFAMGDYKGTIEVYEYCNLHGLWKATIES